MGLFSPVGTYNVLVCRTLNGVETFGDLQCLGSSEINLKGFYLHHGELIERSAISAWIQYGASLYFRVGVVVLKRKVTQ